MLHTVLNILNNPSSNSLGIMYWCCSMGTAEPIQHRRLQVAQRLCSEYSTREAQERLGQQRRWSQ